MKKVRPVALEQMFTTAQVAKRLNVSRQTVARWVRNKEVKAIRLPSGMIRISSDEVARILGKSA